MRWLVFLALLASCQSRGTDSIILFGCNCENAATNSTTTTLPPSERRKKQER